MMEKFVFHQIENLIFEAIKFLGFNRVIPRFALVRFQFTSGFKQNPLIVSNFQVNLEDLFEQNLKNSSDWESQLRLLRQKQRQVERIPGELRIECVRVGTAGVRTFAEDLLKR